MPAPPELTSEDDIQDARLALHRCASEADFAAWARTWGAAAMAGLLEFADRGCTDDGDGE